MKFLLALLVTLFFCGMTYAQSYFQTTTSPNNYNLGIIHNAEIQLGTNSLSSTLREKCVLKFGNTNLTKIGEFQAASRISFQATSFSFLGGNIYNPYMVDFTIGSENGEGYERIRLHHNGKHAYIDFKDNLNFRADKGWISPLILFGNGTVGVGFPTTYNTGEYKNQGYMLAVNGGILAEKVKIIADVPSADYVFTDNYNLMSICDVEEFIISNKHLPDIPSADEFCQNGYLVGEMDNLLLQKIEELTLHIIELNKRISRIKSEK